MTNEERDAFLRKVYDEANRNPNAFDKWCNDLSRYFPSPKSLFLPLPYDRFCWAHSDNYKPEEVEEFGAWLRPYIDQAKSTLRLTEPLFLKSSITSNKFRFSNTRVTSDLTDYQLGDNALSMIYLGLMGDQYQNGLVLREYIDPDCPLPTIYNGMPLRTEFRVFYNFDSHTVLGVFPYWERKTMEEGLESQPGDLKTFRQEVGRLEREFEERKEEVRQMVSHNLRNFRGHPGGGEGTAVWSLDFMPDRRGMLWFIDAAIGWQSAYAELLEEGSIC